MSIERALESSYRSRRRFLQHSMAGAIGLSLGSSTASALTSASNLHLAPFRFDVTPPTGHSLCGGWIKPVIDVDDRLEAIGIILLGAGDPIVLCAVDWTGLLNNAHVQWRQAIAEAAGTSADRVAVQCVHQHNAPMACVDAERIVAEQGDLPHIVDLDFFRRCLDQARSAVAAAVKRPRRVTAIAHGEAEVHEVASNRRVSRFEDGRVKQMRGSSCRDAALRAMPEGTIDPLLKTVAFFDQDTKIAACHYYATHPMSYYGDGRVSSDFVGLARKRLQAEQPDCQHLYFTGCAGNISAGKYNDGSKPLRKVLADRMHDALQRSDQSLQRSDLESLDWRTVEILPEARDTLSIDALQATISNKENPVVGRNRPSYMLSWLQRLVSKVPIVMSSLQLGEISLLHLPAESFIEYQLRAQAIGNTRFVATAAYGDGGPWYIPTAEEYPNGGYEVSVAFCDAEIDSVMTAAMKKLLA